MFSSALKSISSTNITANYSISPNATGTAGPWKIFDAKQKKTGKTYSAFVFERKSLEAHGNSLGRSSAAAYKRVTEEVVERLRKEASALAKLRHPSILELVEPVEDTRGGGLQFVTEAVTASLAGLLQEKDDQERAGGVGGRSSRYVTEDADGTRRRRELEIDELEIQKGLLQISKALDFLHENAGLVHANLTPEAILVNAKSDWKLAGLSFCSPPDNSTKATSFQPISLSEVLNLDPRLPRFVQISLDYTSPDFVLDNNLTSAADMFSLGLLCIALYNSPHRSPLEANSSISAYKRLFTSSSTVPSANNGFLASRPIPKDLSQSVLPRLITRRPAQRMSARDFQQSEYFDNILVSTIRFMDAFPEKTPNEKASFLRGLNKVLPSFPKSVMERKILPALLDEMKDRELLSLILHNVFKIIELLPSTRRAFGDKVRPSLKDIFVINAKQSQEKDPARDAGLMVVLEKMTTIADNCSGKEFKDGKYATQRFDEPRISTDLVVPDILPIVLVAIESQTHSLVDAALRGLPAILPVLDFTTIKGDLFPVVASVFSKTNSLAIKVRGLQAFVVLCGGSSDGSSDDGLDGLTDNRKKKSSSTALDKYTMQEKIVPLVKGIKTKEPAVALEALKLLKVVGGIADADFVAMEILPVLWYMSLGPLLDLKQFRAFMELIRTLSKRVEDEHTKKLEELSGATNGSTAAPSEDFMSFGGVPGAAFETNSASEDDFERLVKGKAGSLSSNPMEAGWDAMPAAARITSPVARTTQAAAPPAFSWSTPSPTPAAAPAMATYGPKQTSFRTVTPDLGRFETLTPSATQFSQPLQPTSNTASSTSAPTLQPATGSASWSTAVASNHWAASSTPSYQTSNPLSPQVKTSYGPGLLSTVSGVSLEPQRPSLGQSKLSGFSLPPPPHTGVASGSSSFSLNPPPSNTTQSQNMMGSYGSGTAGAASSMNPINSMNNMNGLVGAGMGMAALQAQQRQFQPQQQAQPPKSGLDKYESLI
jgi:SCY1-like protein 2